VGSGIISIDRSFNLKDVITNLDGNVLDVGLVPNNLGTNVNVQAEAINKVRVVHHIK